MVSFHVIWMSQSIADDHDCADTSPFRPSDSHNLWALKGMNGCVVMAKNLAMRHPKARSESDCVRS